MDATERELLAATADEVLSRATGGGAAATADALTGLGWLEMLAAEPADAVAIVFGALGATNGVPTVLDDVLAAALALDPDPSRAVLLPRYGTWGPDPALGTARLASATEVVVVRGRETRAELFAVDRLMITPVRGIDPDGGWYSVHVPVDETADADLGAVRWSDAVAAGRRALGHELAGACRTMLGFAVEHATGREQFGRSVARFQAVRHRLAEAFVAVEALDATLATAWEAPGDLTAMLAKAWSGRAAAIVGTQCQQVLAGIGFTTDHPYHRFLKRTMVLDGILGAAEDLTTAIGHELLARRRIPTLVEL